MLRVKGAPGQSVREPPPGEKPRHILSNLAFRGSLGQVTARLPVNGPNTAVKIERVLCLA
jgi:hypothetical protein